MICRMTEWQCYDRKDKHQQAFASLKGQRASAIVHGLNLGHDATVVRACLNCHALPEVGGFLAGPARLEEGVTCVACHGPYWQWVGEHPAGELWRSQAAINPGRLGPDNWINLDRKQKQLLKGMTDLWDPVRRAEVCASCHIGNYREKKVITHAMYAAGHPPLPSFEAATFSEFQPRHWQYLREKDDRKQQLLQPFDPNHLERAELVAITGLVVLRESMKLFADQAAVDCDGPPGAAWPDFARYDCQACHHELQVTTRTELGRGLAPGRPADPPWPHALVLLGIEATSDHPRNAAKERDWYDALVRSLHGAWAIQPFGDRGQAIQAAEMVSRWADQLLKRRASPIDQNRARALLAEACRIEQGTVLDYDAARQRAWAAGVLYQDILAADPACRANPTIVSALQALDNLLLLKLPAAQEQVPIERSLKTRLDFANKYAATAVRNHFDQIFHEVVAGRLRL
jgi:hypothetical protein